ncbi:hypothetical protein [Thermosynechococcus sp. NK55a]|uniref:hypothetical protein n=1 Tax=Thermosynechococcus sp. NK55a TaxID=1394889 RepID=UPI000413B0C4|nr:hypothetical protein [Thermosynechococcus sp. NK55a]
MRSQQNTGAIAPVGALELLQSSKEITGQLLGSTFWAAGIVIASTQGSTNDTLTSLPHCG